MFSSVFLLTCGSLFLSAAFACAQLPGDTRPPRRGPAQATPLTSSDSIAAELDRSMDATINHPSSKLRKEIKEKLKVSDEEKAGYKKSLNDGKANIVRLLSAFSCNTSQIIDVGDPRCSENPDFFEGAYYSFRYKDYGESPWTDLSLVENEFTAGNKWQTLGFLVDLGHDAEFGKVDENTREAKTLWDLPSAETLDEKSEQKTKLEKGFTYEDIFVSSKAKFRPDHTYLLRTISYRIEGGFAMFGSGFNWYNTDSMFVLRVANFDGQRTATIAWKKLLQRLAPMLKDKEKGE